MGKDRARPQGGPGCEASPSAADGVFAQSHPSRAEDLPCTDCGGFGVNYQLERACDCGAPPQWDTFGGAPK